MGRGRVAVLLLSAGLGAAPAACNDSSSSKSVVIGDELNVDVDATNQAAPPPPTNPGSHEPFDPGSDASYYESDGGYYSTSIDGYAPLSWCNECACPKSSYCFGGATGYTSFNGSCNHLEAGPNPPLAIGCNPTPSACDASDCVCLIEALAGQMPCNAECVGSKAPVSVYCPAP
jgi:hypothetical protein